MLHSRRFSRKPYSIPDQNGESLYTFSVQNSAKTVPFRFGAAHTYMASPRPPSGIINNTTTPLHIPRHCPMLWFWYFVIFYKIKTCCSVLKDTSSFQAKVRINSYRRLYSESGFKTLRYINYKKEDKVKNKHYIVCR